MAGPVITDVVVALAYAGRRWGIPRSSGVTTWACNRGEHERSVEVKQSVSNYVPNVPSSGSCFLLERN